MHVLTDVQQFDGLVGLVHGQLDRVVPPSQSLNFAMAAREFLGKENGNKAEVQLIPAEGHFEVLDPSSATWAAVLELIEVAIK